MTEYEKNVPSDFKPEYYTDRLAGYGSIEEWAEHMFTNSIFTDPDKVKGLTGENPSVFFKRYKLNRAAQLLKERKYNISEIADMTGFSTLSHFSTSFKKQFGVSPSEYVK